MNRLALKAAEDARAMSRAGEVMEAERMRRYEALNARALELLDELRDRLGKHAIAACANARDWSPLGELGAIVEVLERVKGYLDGK